MPARTLPTSLSRGLALAGGVLAVLSGSFVWAKADPASLGFPVPPAFVNEAALLRRGFDLRAGSLSIGWVVAALGIVSAALLLWDGGAESAAIATIRMILGGLILFTTLLYFSLYPGVLLAAIAGALILIAGFLAVRRGESA